MITGNLVPDHATVARFICRHERALAALFGEVLRLCHRAGLVRSGVVSIDGTRMAGSCSPEVNLTFEQIAREILAETKAADEAEDEEFGERCGDELPEQLRTPEGRREFFGQARDDLERDEGDSELAEPEPERTEEVALELDAERIVARTQGRRGGCARAAARSSSIDGKTRIRSRGRVRSGCCWRSSGWTAISTWNVVLIRRMRRIGRGGG